MMEKRNDETQQLQKEVVQLRDRLREFEVVTARQSQQLSERQSKRNDLK